MQSARNCLFFFYEYLNLVTHRQKMEMLSKSDSSTGYRNKHCKTVAVEINYNISSPYPSEWVCVVCGVSQMEMQWPISNFVLLNQLKVYPKVTLNNFPRANYPAVTQSGCQTQSVRQKTPSGIPPIVSQPVFFWCYGPMILQQLAHIRNSAPQFEEQSCFLCGGYMHKNVQIHDALLLSGHVC